MFVGAATVWKLKKAVRLDFVDLTGIEQREAVLRQELALNRRTAPALYRGVMPVRRGDAGLEVGEGSGEVVDWVLLMAPVPADDFLDAMAARGELGPALLDAVADAVAAFHATLMSAPHGDWPDALRRIVEGNARAAIASALDPARVDTWAEAMRLQIAAMRTWLAVRQAEGFVRRAHGDLHLGNLCLWEGRPVLIDALEFDEALGTVDLGHDLAFLLMDLDRRAGRPAANRVLCRYVGRSGDAGLVAGLPLYLSQRAMVRAHVEAGQAGAAYLDAAELALHPAPGLVVAIGGLPGTGKTTLARALAPGLGRAPGALVLRSDETRKRLFGRAPEERLGPEGYSGAANARTDAALLAMLREAAASEHAVIVDATGLDPAFRSAIEAVADDAGRGFVGLWLTAPTAMLEERIAGRRGDASDATVDVLRRMRDPGPGTWRPIPAKDAATALAMAQESVKSALGAC